MLMGFWVGAAGIGYLMLYTYYYKYSEPCKGRVFTSLVAAALMSLAGGMIGIIAAGIVGVIKSWVT